MLKKGNLDRFKEEKRRNGNEKEAMFDMCLNSFSWVIPNLDCDKLILSNSL